MLLIHDNANIRSLSYSEILHVEDIPSGVYAICARVGYAVLIFVVCILIEKVRISIFTLWENRKMKILCNRLQDKFYRNWQGE